MYKFELAAYASCSKWVLMQDRTTVVLSVSAMRVDWMSRQAMRHSHTSAYSSGKLCNNT